MRKAAASEDALSSTAGTVHTTSTASVDDDLSNHSLSSDAESIGYSIQPKSPGPSVKSSSILQSGGTERQKSGKKFKKECAEN